MTPGALPEGLTQTGLDCIGHDAATFAAATGGRVLTPVMPIAEAIARIAARRHTTATQRPAPLYIRSADAAPPSDAPPALLP